jgi:hypothetical protein
MVEHFPLAQVNHYLWRRQGFARDRESAPRAVLDDLMGIYATAPTCYLSWLVRDPAFHFSDLDRILYEERRAARIRAMRYSTFIVTGRLLPAVHQATKAQALANRWKLGKLAGITEAQYEELAQTIEGLLAAKNLTASEIKKALPEEMSGMEEALNYVIPFMNAEGRLVRAKARGGWKSDLFEYARFDRWMPAVNLNEISPGAACVVLAREYFDGYGPATSGDFRWWSGLPKAEAQMAVTALEGELVPVEIEGVDHWMLAAKMERLRECPARLPQGIRLLPVWDAYLMAYRDRQRYLPKKWVEYVYDKAGNATSTILLNGTVGGVWDIQEEKKTLIVKIAFFEKAEPVALNELETWLTRLAEGTGHESAFVVQCEAPLRVTEGPRNRFLSPLKEAVGEKIFAL